MLSFADFFSLDSFCGTPLFKDTNNAWRLSIALIVSCSSLGQAILEWAVTLFFSIILFVGVFFV